MVKLKRNSKTGIVESYRNGKKIGSVYSMGDVIYGTDRSKPNKQKTGSHRSEK